MTDRELTNLIFSRAAQARHAAENESPAAEPLDKIRRVRLEMRAAKWGRVCSLIMGMLKSPYDTLTPHMEEFVDVLSLEDLNESNIAGNPVVTDSQGRYGVLQSAELDWPLTHDDVKSCVVWEN